MLGQGMNMFRIGLGTDSHAFALPDAKKELKMGGVVIPNENGLEGDSDGDILLHSSFNAIMSAIGEQGLGFYFNKGNMDKYGDSSDIIRLAMQKMREKGFSIVNASLAIEGQKPRMKNHIPSIQKKMSELLDVPVDCIGVTVTSGETLTAFGKGEGIYCQTIVLLQKK